MFRRQTTRIAAFSAILTLISIACFVLASAVSLNNVETVVLTVVYCLTVVVITVIYAVVEYRLISKPLKLISDETHKIAQGAYDSDLNDKMFDADIVNLSSNILEISDELQRIEQIRKSFVANASHELRSPLTSIQGFAQAMLDGTIDPKDRKKYLEIVLFESRRLSQTVHSMLDLTRLDSGKSELKLSDFSFSDMASGIVENFKPALKLKNMSLACSFCDADLVVADKEKIRRVLINLIDNAIKYSFENGTVILKTELIDGKLHVSVIDNGIGIAKKDQMLIFERFYMVDKARTPTKEKSTGLGLSIVKKIIEEHHQKIFVSSEKGAGSIFTFTLDLSSRDAG